MARREEETRKEAGPINDIHHRRSVSDYPFKDSLIPVFLRLSTILKGEIWIPSPQGSTELFSFINGLKNRMGP